MEDLKILFGISRNTKRRHRDPYYNGHRGRIGVAAFYNGWLG